MPRPPALRWRLVVNSYTCPTCGAGAGYGCRTTGNRPAGPTGQHAARAQQARDRGWAAADEPPNCAVCHRPLPEDVHTPTPAVCVRCTRRKEGQRRQIGAHATRDAPGPDGSYDVPLWEDQ